MAIRRPARLVAPLVLLVCAAAVLVIVQNTLSDEGSTPAPAATSTSTTSTTSATSRRKTYRVRSGDTLGGIAERMDVPVDQLLELNPDVDPQSLRAGQRLRLRE
jgi:peptidoglycan endopeptidase LytE